MSIQSPITVLSRPARNVIAFPGRARRASLQLVCSDGEAMRVCAHCGGWMAPDESDEDCSSRLRASKA